MRIARASPTIGTNQRFSKNLTICPPFAAMAAWIVASRVENSPLASMSHVAGRGIKSGLSPLDGRYPESSRSCPMPFQLPDLPFDKNALAPHMSDETLE